MARLEDCFSPANLRTVALCHFGLTQPQVKTMQEQYPDTAAFKRELLTRFRNMNSETKEARKVSPDVERVVRFSTKGPAHPPVTLIPDMLVFGARF